MPIAECIAKHTHRQYLTTLAWLDMQWDAPSRTDQYLMQIACEVRRVLSKNPNNIQTNDFKLKFTRDGDKAKVKLTKEQATALSKSRWLSMMTMDVTVINTKEGVDQVLPKKKQSKAGANNHGIRDRARAAGSPTGGGRKPVRDQLK